MNSHPQRSDLSPSSIIQEVSRRTPPKTITNGKRSPEGVVVGCLSHPCKVTPSGVLRRTSSIPFSRDATKASCDESELQGRNRKRCSMGSSTQVQPTAQSATAPARIASRDRAANIRYSRKPKLRNLFIASSFFFVGFSSITMQTSTATTCHKQYSPTSFQN